MTDNTLHDDDVREALAWSIARAHGTPERVADHILSAFAVASILGPTSPPSAEETREALARLVARGPEPMIHHYRVVAEILAAFEVRPHGTVTDAEVEAAWLAWDAVSVDDDPNGWLSIRAALEAAREAR